MINLEKIRSEKPIKELLKFSIINIDKPSGPTSFQISHSIKNSLGISKTAHFGTLDPMVSGVLPVALGRACRLNDYFMHRDKEYVGIMRLHEIVSPEKLREIINSFIGKIIQMPPVRSRVKRAPREREIKEFRILEIEGKDVLFSSVVQAGTYIRKLIHDLGEKIGGAHMLELRRIKAGIFTEKNLVNMYDFEKAVSEYGKGNEEPLRSILIPAEIVSAILPSIQANPDSLKQILIGKPLFPKDILNKSDLDNVNDCFVLLDNDMLIGVYHKIQEKDIIARPDFVLN